MTSALHLSAGSASATVLPQRGGLVSSLRLPLRGQAVEVLYLPPDFDAGASSWPGGGLPICFPFAGRVFHQGQPFRYELDGAVRSMPIHGFAYALAWELVKADAASASLRLRANAETLALYPFDFELSATVALASDRLQLHLTAKHCGSEGKMPVAGGLHPYLRLAQAAYERGLCTLEHHAETAVAVTSAGGAGKASPVAPARLPLAEALTANGILSDHRRPEASLEDKAAGMKVSVRWGGGYRQLVLWRTEGAGFQCIEPWMALPDAVASGGAAWLGPGEAVTASATIALTGV